MISVLSPAKTLDFSHNHDGLKSPHFKKESLALASILKTKKQDDIKSLMHLSDKLAEENYHRYQNFKTRFNNSNSKAAIYTFNGDVYRGFDASTLEANDVEFANNHLRILSGLYGVLEPNDKMQAYRLEMGTSLANENGKNLYHFWDDKIAKRLNADLRGHDHKVIVNLASKEYFSAIKLKALKAKVLHIEFKELRDGKLKIISFNAKRARGLMARYIVDHKIDQPEHLKGFNYESYGFDEKGSTEDKWLFTK